MTRMTRTTRTIVAALAAATLALLPGQSAGAADPPPGAVRLLEANIASGDFSACEQGVDCMAKLLGQIVLYDPDVVAGEEFCQSDVDRLQEEHPDWDVFFQPMVPAGQLNGCNLGAKGQVLAGPSLGDPEVFDLPGDFTENGVTRDYKMLCARTTSDHRRHCVVHLRHNADFAEVRRQQVDKILTTTQGWQRHTISGDFNLQSSNSIFKKLTNAGYVDTVTGRVTHILLKGDIDAYGGRSIPQDEGASDHALTRAWVDWAS